MRLCKYCEKEIPVHKDKRQKFCNRSCATSYNNRKYPKRCELLRVCPICQEKRKGYLTGRCHQCKVNATFRKVMATPIENYYRDKSPSRVKYNSIRVWARQVLENEARNRACQIKGCSFDLAVHVCHIKDIASFSDWALMGEVNAPSNLVYLCPNHHVMLDKGTLKLN